VSHIVWYSPPTPETTIAVVGCTLLCPAVNVNGNVKASYGLSVRWRLSQSTLSRFQQYTLWMDSQVKGLYFVRYDDLLDVLTTNAHASKIVSISRNGKYQSVYRIIGISK